MVDKHDEKARELLGALEYYAPWSFARDAQAVASALRKAEADGLSEAANLAEVELDLFHPLVKELRSRARAAEKEPNG